MDEELTAMLEGATLLLEELLTDEDGIELLATIELEAVVTFHTSKSHSE